MNKKKKQKKYVFLPKEDIKEDYEVVNGEESKSVIYDQNEYRISMIKNLKKERIKAMILANPRGAKITNVIVKC